MGSVTWLRGNPRVTRGSAGGNPDTGLAEWRRGSGRRVLAGDEVNFSYMDPEVKGGRPLGGFFSLAIGLDYRVDVLRPGGVKINTWKGRILKVMFWP